MAEIIEIKVPDIGGAENVEVVEIMVEAGDVIALEQELIAVETDKATMEIPSSSAGTLKELRIKQGSKISEGDVIGMLELIGDCTAANEEPEAEETLLVDKSSSADESSSTVTTSVNEDPVSSAPSVITAESSVASESVNSSSADQAPHASPSVRKLARELDVPLVEVKATGKRGRITKDDVFGYVQGVMRNQPAEQSEGTGTGLPGILPWPKVDFEKFGSVERMELPRIRKISGANLHRNWVTIPHVTNHEDADITDLNTFRLELNKGYKAEGKKVTLLAFLVKASVAALKKFPEFNASLDGDELVLKRYYHIGFAADTPNGLVVPVIRDADKKGVMEIADEIQNLAKRAREGKLSVSDMSGGCFSISSLGGIGGTYFTPIINAPEVAILGVAKARTQLIWNGEAAEPRLILPMSLSWDHRVVDGAQAGKFNAYLSSLLADFRRILL
jgi:pyruvate dehydrogenase E2 component (dihydrolipoyllysine-residue acetyltransferase)